MKTILKLVLATILIGSLLGVKSLVFPPPQPTQYLTAEATRGDLRETVLATGTLEAFKQVSVGAQVSGQVKSLKVDLGDTVHKGDLIAEIDSKSRENDLRIAEAKLDDVRAQLQAKQATLAQAESEFSRQKGMLHASATSKQEYESAVATLAETRADIAALNAQIVEASINVDTARIELGYCAITAPMDGIIVAVVTKEGQTVNAAQEAPTIVKLAQLDIMTVKAEVSEADIVHVRPGQKATFTIFGAPDVPYEATLRSIEPAPDSITDDDTSTTSSEDEAIYYNALLDVPNPDQTLRISMTAEVTILLNEAKDALLIPESALGAKDPQGRYTVRILGPDGQPAERNVRTGMSDTVNVQILEGLDAGDRVILGEADPEAALQQAQNHRPPMRL